MKYKLLCLSSRVIEPASRSVHYISTSQKKVQTRAMLDRMIRCVMFLL